MKIYRYKIVNDDIEPFNGEVSYNKHDLPVDKYCYGQGGVEWSLIEWKKDAPIRRKIDKYYWAYDRYKWAKENAPSELAEINKILDEYYPLILKHTQSQ